MDNPQERPVSKEYVAGLICGEGWFGLTVQQTPKLKTRLGFTIRPRFCLQMNDRETMGLVIDAWRSWELPAYIVNTAKGIRIEAGGMARTKAIADFFLPYLTGHKREVAETVLEFIDSRLSRAQAAPYGRREFQLVDKLRGLNAGNGKRRLESSEAIRRALAAAGE